MGRLPTLVSSIVAAFLLASSPAWAGEAMAALSLDEALRLGATEGPATTVAKAPGASLKDAERAAKAVLTQAPTVQVTAGPRFDPSPTFDIGASVSLDVPYRNVRGARRGVVGASQGLLLADVRRAQADGALRAAVAWSRVLETKELMRNRREALEQSEGIIEIARKRAHAGVAMPSELAVAKGDGGLSRANYMEAEGLHFEAVAELRLAVGRDSTAPIDVRGDLYAEADERLARPSPGENGGIARNPDVIVAEANHALARRQKMLTETSLSPQVGAGASFVKEGTGNTVVLGLVTVPFSVVDQAAFETSRQRGVEDSAAAAVKKARAEAETRLAIAHHDVHHTRDVRDAVLSEAIPSLREALRLAKAQYEAGTSELALTLLARQRLLAAEELLARSAADVLRADLRLAHVRGMLVPENP